MAKDKHIISEIDSFFSKNDYNRAINCIIVTISRLNLNFSGIGIEKRHNCKLTSLQVLELLLLFPFFILFPIQPFRSLEVIFLSKGYVLPFPGTGPHRLAQAGL